MGECVGGWVTNIAAEKSNWHLQFFWPRFLSPNFHLHIAIAGLSNSRYCVFASPAIAMGKFSKIFDKDSISRIWGSCDDSSRGGGWCAWVRLHDKNRSQKNRVTFSIFSPAVWFFSRDFCRPISPIAIVGPRNLRYFVFVSHLILNSQKCWTKTQYREFEGPVIVKGGGGGESEWRKLRPKKMEDYEVGRFFFDIYWHLAKPDDEADQPHSTW